MTSTTVEQLKTKHCRPCEGGLPPIPRDEVLRLLAGLEGWRLDEEASRIRREWVARDFQAAIDFFNRVAQIAEAEQHHPDLHLTGYRRITIELTTHAIDGLSENDFILAARINDLPLELQA